MMGIVRVDLGVETVMGMTMRNLFRISVRGGINLGWKTKCRRLILIGIKMGVEVVLLVLIEVSLQQPVPVTARTGLESLNSNTKRVKNQTLTG